MKKTHKGIAKRFKVTGTGKVKFRNPAKALATQAYDQQVEQANRIRSSPRAWLVA